MKDIKIGDKVWYAARDYVRVNIKCPDCLGTGVLTVRFADGKEVNIHCATCGHGYELPTGFVHYYQYQNKAREVVICGADIRPEKTEYRFDTNHIAGEDEFFATKEEADIRAKELADKATLDEMNRLTAKEKPTRTWAWNARYHRDRLKQAEKDVAYHTMKLNAAKIKSKEEPK